MKKAVLVTGHYWGSKRKAGFHWIAESLARQGWDVLFMTTALSWLSVAKRDYRLSYPVRSEARRLVPKQNGITSFVWFTPWHPANLRFKWFNHLATGLYSGYGRLKCDEALEWVKQSSLVVFESTAGLLLFERFRRLNPQARFVYRVSDDLNLLGCHPVIVDYETQHAGQFDLISVPSRALARKFSRVKQVVIQQHGLEKPLYDTRLPSPYPSPGTKAVLVGTSHVDYDFLRRAARLRPDWSFHLVGPLKAPGRLPNIVEHGEIPFRDTVAFVQHADIGLQTRSFHSGAESLSDSLKVIQYTYCRLPIVAPQFMATHRPHIFHYTPGVDDSIDWALRSASSLDRSTVNTSDVQSWDEVSASLLTDP